MEYGLIGKTLKHSFSPEIHNLLGNDKYQLKELAENELQSFFSERKFKGINVTIPYKESVMQYLDEIDSVAKSIGAVNTVINKNGVLFGYNTDYYGLLKTVERLKVNVKGEVVAVLGSGGASKCAKVVFENLGAKKVLIVSRNGQVNYQNLSREKDISILVNASPVGMKPNAGECLVDLNQLPLLKCVIDLVYNPKITELLFRAKSKNIDCVNGLPMLVYQAISAHQLWSGEKVQEEMAESIINKIDKETINIVLIGMPGSGKTSVGKVIAQKLNREFYDSDEEFEKTYSTTPSSCIKESGEQAFREKEQEIIKTLSSKNGIVLATGGGAILKEINRKNLISNGIVVFIERDIEKLATDNRPLSAQGKITELYEKRLPIYESCCDIKVNGNKEINSVASEIIERVFKENK